MKDKPVQIRLKQHSWLMKFISVFVGKWFMTGAWTTIGRGRIWAPSTLPESVDGVVVVRNPNAPDGIEILSDVDPDTATAILRRRHVILHEIVHTRQIRRWLLLFHLTYLWFPLPVLLAWGRWRWEREAYMVNLRAGERTVDDVVDVLWRKYALTWPRAWMRHWFERELAK